MESDLAQIKLLLWIILAVQILFVAANVACRLLGCGKDGQPDYGDLIMRGKYEDVLSQTKKRLETYPADPDALYFRARAFECMGLRKSAEECIRRLIRVEPRMAQTLKDWIEAMETSDKIE